MKRYQGDDWKFNIALKDTSGVAIDITSDTITFDLVNLLKDTASTITETFTITDGPNGLAEVEIPSASTESLSLGVNFISFTRLSGTFTQVIYQNDLNVKKSAKGL